MNVFTGYSGEKCEQSQCDNYCEHGNCTINGGVPQCNCWAGYSGKRCDQDSCKLTCLNGGTCQRSSKKTMCVCPQGYQGKRCEQNLCGCRNGGTCIPTKSEQGHDTCLCPSHFMGAHCERFVAKSCEEVNCRNGGECFEGSDNQLSCRCPSAWTGPFCETENPGRDVCNSYCMNGATCTLPNSRDMTPICS